MQNLGGKQSVLWAIGKQRIKNTAEINWNTEYKSEAYKYTIKLIAKITSG